MSDLRSESTATLPRSLQPVGGKRFWVTKGWGGGTSTGYAKPGRNSPARRATPEVVADPSTEEIKASIRAKMAAFDLADPAQAHQWRIADCALAEVEALSHLPNSHQCGPLHLWYQSGCSCGWQGRRRLFNLLLSMAEVDAHLDYFHQIVVSKRIALTASDS